MHTIFPIFLTQRQFGIVWIANVLPLVPYLWIILEVKMFLEFAVFSFPCCLVHT